MPAAATFGLYAMTVMPYAVIRGSTVTGGQNERRALLRIIAHLAAKPLRPAPQRGRN
jgi:hypothetical protein